MRISEAIVGRQSIRAFLPDEPVSDEQIESLLSVAGRAPSGSNIQPWHVYVVRGETKARITDACEARYLSGDEGEYEYHYYPRAWREPYIGRRRQTGFGLYGTHVFGTRYGMIGNLPKIENVRPLCMDFFKQGFCNRRGPHNQGCLFRHDEIEGKGKILEEPKVSRTYMYD